MVISIDDISIGQKVLIFDLHLLRSVEETLMIDFND